MRWDVAVVGAGVVGCAVARALAQRGERVLVLDKEPRLGEHQSGRNSGVVHAGVTYKPGSLKARFSVAGSAALRAYAPQRSVPLEEVGKLWVALREEELPALERLRAQGEANGVEGLRVLDDKALREVEPHAAGLGALHSPRSAIVDGIALVRALAEDARAAGAAFHLGDGLAAASLQGAWTLRTSRATHEAERLVTCAGLQSDRVAALCGVRVEHRIVPFRGEYWRLRPGREGLVRGLVYPVPDPRFPFVGVHFTKRTDGSVLVGPSAVLALGREAYRHVLQADARDVADMASHRGFWRMLARPDVRAQAREEAARALLPQRFLRDARALLPDVQPGDLVRSHSGIRAQMVDAQGQFVDDLLLEERERAVHVLNAVSPGLTCSLPLAEHVADRVQACL